MCGGARATASAGEIGSSAASRCGAEDAPKRHSIQADTESDVGKMAVRQYESGRGCIARQCKWRGFAAFRAGEHDNNSLQNICETHENQMLHALIHPILLMHISQPAKLLFDQSCADQCYCYINSAKFDDLDPSNEIMICTDDAHR